MNYNCVCDPRLRPPRSCRQPLAPIPLDRVARAPGVHSMRNAPLPRWGPTASPYPPLRSPAASAVRPSTLFSREWFAEILKGSRIVSGEQKIRLWLVSVTLLVLVPSVGSASSVSNVFLSSMSGSAVIEVGDTIQCSVTIELNAAQAYTAVLWTLSGDIGVAETEPLPWPNTKNLVTNWAWNYAAGKGTNVTQLNSPKLPMR